MSEEEKIQIMRDAIEVLEEAVEAFTTKLGPPLFIAEKGKERFRYPEPTSLHLQVLKAVRIVSGLNASICLLEKGYVQEIGVLLRTIDDFIDEITFLHDAHTANTVTADQKRFVVDFFKEKPITTEERLESPKKPYMVPKKKIRAAIGRFLGKFSNPYKVSRISEEIDNSLSGYVHGAFSQIMELYEGGSEQFRLHGMLNTPRIPACRWQIAAYIHRSLNTFAEIAETMNLKELIQKLIDTRKTFEMSEAYVR